VNGFTNAIYAIATALLIKVLYDLWKSKFPSKKDSTDLSKTRADIFNTGFEQANTIYNMLTTHVDELVEKRTKELKDIIVNEQLKHAKEIQEYFLRLADEQKKNEGLQNINEQLLEKNKTLQELNATLVEKNSSLEKRVSGLEARIKEVEKTNGNH
jgi:hypothetical protein